VQFLLSPFAVRHTTLPAGLSETLTSLITLATGALRLKQIEATRVVKLRATEDVMSVRLSRHDVISSVFWEGRLKTSAWYSKPWRIN